ncbi:MAG: gamma-glutamylcyclotransferase family protein [Rhodothermales bacterium]|nr:gamma-glutamylcyclotransferase family protein [Rhodothermales bacterium]
MNLFVYGTLLFPEVMEAVTGRRLDAEDAVLTGYHRLAVRHRVYPGLTETPGATVAGRLYRGLTPALMSRLDRFEGPLYERRRLPVQRADLGFTEAFVYVVRPEHRDALDDREWDPAHFAEHHLPAYLAASRRTDRADDASDAAG